MCARADGAADDGAKVVRIFNAVEQDEEGALALGLCGVEHIGNFAVFHARNLRHNALMVAGFAAVAKGHTKLVQLFPADFIHPEVAVPRQGHDLAEGAVRLAGNEDAVNAAATLDGLAHGVAPHHKVGQLIRTCVRRIRRAFHAFALWLGRLLFIGLLAISRAHARFTLAFFAVRLLAAGARRIAFLAAVALFVVWLFIAFIALPAGILVAILPALAAIRPVSRIAFFVRFIAVALFFVGAAPGGSIGACLPEHGLPVLKAHRRFAVLFAPAALVVICHADPLSAAIRLCQFSL